MSEDGTSDEEGFGAYLTPVEPTTLIGNCLGSLNVYLSSLERSTGTISEVGLVPPRYRNSGVARWIHDRTTEGRGRRGDVHCYTEEGRGSGVLWGDS